MARIFDHVDCFVRSVLAERPHDVEGWRALEDSGHLVRTRILTALNNVIDVDAADRAIANLHLDHLIAHDVMSAIIETQSQVALCSVRFLNGDTSRCFIELEALVSEAVDPQKLRMLLHEINRRYASLAPFAVRFAHAPDTKLSYALSKIAHDVDQLVLMAPIGRVAREILESSGGKLELRKARDVAWYRDYRDQYNLFHETSPVLRNLVAPEPESALQRSVDQGLCYLSYLDNRWVGVIAGDHGVLADYPCVKLIERMNFSEVRGRGLASSALQSYAGAIAIDYDTLLGGSISPLNEPSLRSAESVGRRCVRRYTFAHF